MEIKGSHTTYVFCADTATLAGNVLRIFGGFDHGGMFQGRVVFEHWWVVRPQTTQPSRCWRGRISSWLS